MSSNTFLDKLFHHDLRTALKRNTGTMLTILVVFLLLIPFATAGIPGKSIFNHAIQELYIYRLISPRLVIVTYFAVAAAGLAYGLSSFGFLRDTSREEFFFSVGLTRERLYQSRFLAGLIGLLLVIGIPMVITLLLNAVVFGFSAYLLAGWFFTFAGLFLQSLIAFLLSSAACILAGTMTEIVMYELMLFAGFSGMLYSINQILFHTVWNNRYPDTLLMQAERGNDMLRTFDMWNPVAFFLKPIINCSLALQGVSVQEMILRLILWGAIALGLWFAVRQALKVRSAEQAGRKGIRIQVTRIVVFLSMFLVFAVTFSLLDFLNRIFAIAVALAVDLVLYIIWQQCFIHQHPGLWVLISRCVTMLVAVVVVFVITFGAGTTQKQNGQLQDRHSEQQQNVAKDYTYFQDSATGEIDGE